MKSLAIILLCCIAISFAQDNQLTQSEAQSIRDVLLQISKISKIQNREEISVNVNDYIDNAMQIIQNWFIRNGLDPVEVPDVERSLGIWPMRIKLILDRGWMQGLSTVQRGGDATMNYEYLLLNIELPFAFPTVLINYDYKVIYGVFPQTGGIEGKIKNLRLLIDISINTSTLEMYLHEFEIIDAGKISLKFSGNPLIDWISNLVSGAATSILHGIIINIIENQLKNGITDAIDQINEAVRPSNAYLH